MTVAVCFPACSFLCLCIYAYAHFLAYTYFYGGLGLSLRWCVVVRQYVQYVSTYVRQCISTYVCQYASGAVCLSVRADLPFQMSVSVHVHLFALLLHRFCPQRNIQICRSVSFPPCVAAFGFVPVACGVFQPLPGVFLPRTFAPKRQGNAPDAHTAPRFRLSFGQLEGIGRPIPLWVVIAGLSPIRRVRILVSLKTQQGVL